MMIDEKVQYDVRVLNAFKSYGGNNVLKGVTMHVPSCIIYGLLGPSGCGKSTLLQCILGAISLDYGCIDLKIKSLKDVGYMPQDLGLDNKLTIKETFVFYGSLYNMSQTNIEVRIDKLKQFLQLPNLNRSINEISGGQCRRVSLAISLLHDSKIIILDEPTVGVDPLLRQNIWTEFVKMVQEHKKTIIITTHYIEEASQANCIGLMRDGILVEEAPPKDIFIKYRTHSLEQAFLQLCCDQKYNKIVRIDRIQPPKNLIYKIQPKGLMESDNKIELCRIAALVKKNFRVCSRDLLLIFCVILLPVLQSFNFCSCIGVNIKHMPIAIKNDEINYSDCRNYSIDGCIFDEDSNLTMSCIVMDFLASHDYQLVEVKDREAGESIMNNPKYMAFLYFPNNYTMGLLKYIEDRENTDLESLTYARLTMENFVFRNQIKMDVLKSINYLLEETLNRCSEDARRGTTAPLILNILYGHEVNSNTNGSINIFIAMTIFYFPSIFSGCIMMSEKWDGHFSRSKFAGVKLSELLISMLFIATVTLLAETFMSCSITFVAFSNPIIITDGLFVYVLVLLLLGWIGFCIGILTAVLSTTQVGGVYVLTGVSLTQFLLAGAIWPLEGQPYFLREISKLLPIYVAGNTMNNIALKGWTTKHPSVIVGATTLFGYITLLVLTLTVLVKLKKNMWIIQK